jgi:hypothetical protein
LDKGGLTVNAKNVQKMKEENKELKRQLDSCNEIREAEKEILIKEIEKNTELKKKLGSIRNIIQKT